MLNIIFVGLAFHEIWISKNVKFSFLAILANLKKFSLKLMALWRCSYEVPKTVLHYNRFIFWRTSEKSSSLNFLSIDWFPGFWNHFQADIIVFYKVWKSQGSWEPWAVGFWVNRHSKNANSFCKQCFLELFIRHYGFTNYCNIPNSPFSNIIPRRVLT